MFLKAPYKYMRIYLYTLVAKNLFISVVLAQKLIIAEIEAQQKIVKENKIPIEIFQNKISDSLSFLCSKQLPPLRHPHHQFQHLKSPTLESLYKYIRIYLYSFAKSSLCIARLI
jgi:hypothetical protein